MDVLSNDLWAQWWPVRATFDMSTLLSHVSSIFARRPNYGESFDESVSQVFLILFVIKLRFVYIEFIKVNSKYSD